MSALSTLASSAVLAVTLNTQAPARPDTATATAIQDDRRVQETQAQSNETRVTSIRNDAPVNLASSSASVAVKPADLKPNAKSYEDLLADIEKIRAVEIIDSSYLKKQLPPLIKLHSAGKSPEDALASIQTIADAFSTEAGLKKSVERDVLDWIWPEAIKQCGFKATETFKATGDAHATASQYVADLANYLEIDQLEKHFIKPEFFQRYAKNLMKSGYADVARHIPVDKVKAFGQTFTASLEDYLQ